MFVRCHRFILPPLLMLFALCAGIDAQTGHWLTGYYATYNYGVMSTSQLDYSKLTHVIYWPVIPNSGSAAGTLNTTPFGLSATTFSNGATDLVTRAHAAGAKALIGIGGDQSSGATAGFQISTNSTYQATFIKNIVTLMQKYSFDGVDINWEQIQTSDNSDFTSFIANLRAALTTASPNLHLLLTMPPETKPNGGRPDLLAQVYQDLDQVNIQTYQMSGPYCGWETWYNSPLNNGGATFVYNSSEPLPSTTNAIADYTSAGVPQSKLAMGIQFDSEVWTGGQGTSTGGVTAPKQTWTGDGNNAFCSTTNPDAPATNTLAYRLMITTLATKTGYTTNFDSTADQSWLSYDPSGTGTTNEGQDSFVSFDSPTSIARKGVDMSPAQSGVGGSLGGVFIFELSGDYASTAVAGQQHPLLNAANSMKMLLPGLITNLKATTSTGAATLTWTAAPFATSYKVFVATSATGTGTLSTTVSTTQATISSLTAGQEYWFQVQPVEAFGSGAAAQVTATIPGSLAPTVTWSTPASIPYGTPLSSTQLNATASVPGTFVYTPAKGSVPPVGSDTLSVTFTPSSSNYSAVTKIVIQVVTLNTLPISTSFAGTNVGSESLAQSVTVALASAGTIGSIQVLTMGAAGLDFANANGGSCVVGRAYTAGVTCTVNVTFAPTASGTRAGAVVVQTSSGAFTAYIVGNGVAPQVTFDPGTFSTIPAPAGIQPAGLAVDGNRNVYYSDANSNNVYKVTPAGAYSIYYSGGSNSVGAVALDGAGNVFVVERVPPDYVGVVVKAAPSGAASTFAAGFTFPQGLAIDPATGNLFVSDEGVTKVTPAGVSSNFITLFSTILGEPLDYPGGLAVDISGNVYVADTFNSRVLKVDSTGANPSLVPATGLLYPRGLALGGTGNLYIADESTNAVVKITPGGVQSNVVSGTILGADVGQPYDVALDSAENVYADDWTNKRFLKANRNAPASLSFANASVGSVSYDSPRGFTAENSGNAALTFNAPASGTNAAISTGFSFAGANTCPVLTPGSAAQSISAGASCNLAIDFQPVSDGIASGDVTLTDNALNIPGTEQTAPLMGTGAASTKATVTLSGLSTVYSGNPQAATVTTSPSGLAVSITYSGSSAPTKAGSYAVIATVATVGYAGSATGTLVISKATPVIRWPPPAPVTYGTALSSAQLHAFEFWPFKGAGSFSYSPAAGTILPAGINILTTTFTPTDTADVNTVTAQVSLTVNAATSSRVVWIPDYYGGLLQVRVGTTPAAITINLPGCSPNSVAVNNNKAYVVCNANGSNADKILVYNAATIRAAPSGTLGISPLQTITSGNFNSLIGVTFDSSNNLWVASYGNNQIESISASTLNTASPVINVNLIQSPSAPVSLAFATDGTLWVVGQYGGGILLHFPVSQLNQGSNATPDYCLATTNVGGCQYINNVFLSPEGVALFNGDVWVSNNSTGSTGTVPGREIIDLKYSGGTLTVNATFGNSSVPADSPFVCPGGLYASTTHLWVNDQSYNETNPQCGANGDVASETGGVFSFTPAQLTAKTTAISQVLAFAGITGRPGFGGIFVEND